MNDTAPAPDPERPTTPCLGQNPWANVAIKKVMKAAKFDQWRIEDVQERNYFTEDKVIAEKAKKVAGTGLIVNIQYEYERVGKNLRFWVVQIREPFEAF